MGIFDTFFDLVHCLLLMAAVAAFQKRPNY